MRLKQEALFNRFFCTKIYCGAMMKFPVLYATLIAMLPDNNRTKLISFFAALCMFLSAVEYAIPKPLPFLRLGLANLPVLLSLPVFKKRETLFLILLKVLAQGFISGTFFSYIFVFSAAGSFASGILMLVLYMALGKSKHLSAVGLCLAGALANNIAQIGVARLMIFGDNTKYIAPVLLISGLVTGLILGLFSNIFIAQSKWYACIKETAK